MEKIDSLTVKYHDRKVGTLTLSADRKTCVFEYDNTWLLDGFSISPLELPLKNGLFTAKRNPFGGILVFSKTVCRTATDAISCIKPY